MQLSGRQLARHRTGEPFHIAIGHVFAQPPTTADCQAKIHISCYMADRGYDLATGLGTPDGHRLVGQLPRGGSF